MPTVQTTYADNIGSGYAGALANEEHCNLISRTVEDSGGIAFGLAVMQGTEDKGCVVSDASAFLGVTVRTQSIEDGTTDEFAYQESARIATKGIIWVANSGGVAAGDPVVGLADGALGTSTTTPIEGARWDTTASDGDLAQLRLG